MAGVPVIGLADLLGGPEGEPHLDVTAAVADAAARFGFFQVVDHGLADDLLADVWHETTGFFARPRESKRALLRTKENSRGYFDRELTKRMRDRKEVFDFATVPFSELAHDDPRNYAPIDGHNRWPTDRPELRETMMAYLAACEALALRLLEAFTAGLGAPARSLHEHFGRHNTSFIRLNHYPSEDPLSDDERDSVTALGEMALHHHSDAGALTILLQDDVGGLQVEHEGDWIDVEPIDGALVVNTGDMMQVWSNDRYRAALHRVRPIADRERYSLPYFFNPSYDTVYAPLPDAADGHAHYRPINWGEFRQGRADGDFADYGTENQITDYLVQ